MPGPSNGERASEAAPKVEKENVRPTSENRIERKSEVRVEPDLESEGTDSPRQNPEEATMDFFSVNERRLGYKSKLNFAIRKALMSLEYEASRRSGISIERLRTEFSDLRRGRRPTLGEIQIRNEYLVNDYRVFLILFLAWARQKRL